jgi:hypothetical protein
MADEAPDSTVATSIVQPAPVSSSNGPASVHPPADSPAIDDNAQSTNVFRETVPDVESPVPPPRKQSQFRDALASLERERSTKLVPVTPQRSERELNSTEKASVANTRRVWAATIDQRKDSHGDKTTHGLRPSRDLDDEERKRVAATRSASRLGLSPCVLQA